MAYFPKVTTLSMSGGSKYVTEAAVEFGQVLRHQRHKFGYTQQQVAELCGLSIRTIRRIENGQANPYWGATCVPLMRELGITVKMVPNEEAP